jgi:hypothetical protein
MGSISDDDNYVGGNNVGHQLVFILGYKHNGDLGGNWCSCVKFGLNHERGMSIKLYGLIKAGHI